MASFGNMRPPISSANNAEAPSSNNSQLLQAHPLASAPAAMASNPPSTSVTAVTATTPILKSSLRTTATTTNNNNSSTRKRNYNTPSANNSSYIQFSQQTLTKSTSDDESDTDVGSDYDASYTFEDDTSVNAYDKTPEVTNSSITCGVNRVSAKVRRLDLGDVKQRSSLESNNDGGGRREAGGEVSLTESSVGSPQQRKSTINKMCCPSTTVKKGALSRILLSRGINLEEDISPRDAADFPFDSPDKCEGVAVASSDGGNEDRRMFYGIPKVSVYEAAVGLEVAAPPTSPMMLCPPTAMKKQRDLSPPRNLKSHGRANSFLQMFSQEHLPEDNDVSMSPNSPKCPPTTMKFKRTRDRDLSPPKSLRAHGRADSFLQMFSQEPLINENDMDMMKSDDDDDGYSLKSPNELQFQNAKQSPLHATNTSSFSRFITDFEVTGTLGKGSFGCVYKVRSRLDQRMYAIKAAKREARTSTDRDRMLQEVYALAALTDSTTAAHMHIVGYHQAWMEGNRLYIQTELCDGSLEGEMRMGVMMADENRRYKLLREMCLALDLVHRSGMIHLDIKPENIFIKNDQYKLGDFGLVSKIENHDDVEEGDSRYMSMELLSGDLDDLTKSDIFSLGATMYEICLGRPLPENGQEWQDIRHGILQPMNNTAFELQMIVRAMLAPEKESRPSAADLLKKRQLMSQEQQQLIVERNKANAANMALNQMQRIMSNASPKKRSYRRSNTMS
ncbi:hypothetical protein ACHAXN_002045 [Cyclotella atomus]